ncbi:MAG TPA: immunoglobulin domain-containing protein, partial [Candidatus Saccharimonadales bacterium]|nr:immunoglobulin domain-containing protein [Candidatus Saccharimonadales bacterium]
PPANDIVAPATITISADVIDQVSSSYSVSFFARGAEFGTISNSPYQITLTNLLPGVYDLRARVVDSSGLAAPSAVVPVTVQLEANSALVNFDALNATRAPLGGASVNNYLKSFGMTIASLSPGTALTVDRQQHIAGGQAVLAASPPNLLTQTGTEGPVQFTLNFSPLLTQFGFTRPELLANPFVSHPAWQVTALDSAGAMVDQATEAEIDSATNVGAREFSLGGRGGPGIAQVQFASQGSGLTTFNAMLLDNFILTTNMAAFPPAVNITKPITGLVLAAPPAVTISAEASDAAGVAKVSFYANGALIRADTTRPYSINWKNPPMGNYDLTAVAVNVLGLAWTSAVVHLTVEQSADQFGIVSLPANQSVAVGGSVTFTVVTTGTNGVAYQWSHNNVPIPGATSVSLVLHPPIQDSDAGSYLVVATSQSGAQLSAAAALTVQNPPSFTLQPAGQMVPAGANVTMNVTATGGGPFTWQWLLNGARIAGATSRVYSISSAQPLHSGNYQVTVANAAASAISAIAPLIVQAVTAIPETNDNFANRASFNPLLGPVAASNVFATLEPGEPLPDGKTGGKSIWFTWRPTFTGTASLTTEGSDFDTLLAVYTGTQLRKLKAVAADDDSGGYFTSLVTFNVTAGTDYQIDVDGFQGASGRVVLGLPAGTAYQVLSPSSGDSVPVIVKGPASRVVAPGTTVVLSVQFSSATASTCQWNFQGAPIPGATESTLAIPHFQAASVGEYDVLVANSVGSAQSEPANIEISTHQGGVVSSTENKFIDTTNAHPSSPSKLAIVLHPLALGGDTGGFSVAQIFSTVGATIEPGQPAACGQVGGASQWFVYTAPAAGMMQVNTAGSAFNTVLGVFTGAGANFSDLTEVGCGYVTNYLIQGQPSVVIPAVAKGTTFYILIDGFEGASGVAELQIGLGQPPSFRTLPASQWVTAGAAAAFKATAIGSTPAFYQWQLNGESIPGATKSAYTIRATQDDSIGNYTVVVSNVVGVITNSPPAALNLQYEPAIIAGPSNETVTLGQTASFSVAAMGVNVRTNPFVYQWYFNGAPVPRASASRLAFPTRWTNSGSYSLVISNSYGSVTSSAATLTVLDKTKPTVVIKTPHNNFVTNGSLMTVTGTASDNVGILAVQVQVNASGFMTAKGSNAWSILVTLQPGINVISARSVDLSGNVSAIVKHNIIDKAPVPASLSRAAGTYSGLFYPADGATQASSGFLTLTVAGRTPGGFSANLLIDGESYAFAGKFDPSGNARAIVDREGKAPVTLSLRLNINRPDGPMTGVLNAADWSSIFQGSRVVAALGADEGGPFALIVPSAGNPTVGSLALTNTPAGTVLVTGRLADGAGIFRNAPMTQSGAIPLYVPLYSGHGLFLGWINLTNPPASTNFGQAYWIKPGQTNPVSVSIVK